MTRCTRCFGDLLDLTVFCPNCGQPHEPEFDHLLGRTLDRYQLYRRLGEGGLSTVFAAIDTHEDRIVALKISDPRQLVRREFTPSFDAAEARRYWAEMLERMRRKAVALATIHHPNIVRIHDTNTITDELRYVVMEFLRGRTLRAALDERGRLSLADILRIGLEIAAALGATHARGIIHRDLNPRNIFLCEGVVEDRERETGRAGERANASAAPAPPLTRSPAPQAPLIKVIDFGIARLPQPPGAPPFTQHAVMSGTAGYASPEQCQNLPLDHRTDIYSLGAVLYEMATGERLFTGRTTAEIALQQIQAEPVRPRAIVPDLPVSLEALILRALAKAPQARQQSAEELATELRAVSSRIVVAFGATAEGSVAVPAPAVFSEINAATVADDAVTAEQTDEDEPAARLRLIRQRRRRASLALAALVLILATAGLLLGKHLIGGRRMAAVQSDGAVSSSPQTDKQETATGAPSGEPATSTPSNDADALEIAARISTREPSATPAQIVTLPKTQLYDQVRSAPPVVNRAARPAPAPSVRPQAPPTPAPIIAATREHRPSDQPDLEQGPKNDPPAQRPREIAAPPTQDETTVARNSDREPAGVRHTIEDQPRAALPRPEPSDEDNGLSGNNTDVSRKVISWSGTVDRERRVTLELPGVPGTVNIPLSYRKRVGIVEPPGTHNRWRRVILRVFGRGPVSIIIQWWPLSSHIARAEEER